jgi:hypothetical protein
MPTAGTCIYLQVEPNAIVNNRNFLLANWDKYKYLLTFDDALLKFPNAYKYAPNNTWIDSKDAEQINTSSKKFQISSLTGWKSSTNGHRFRIDVLKRHTEFSALSIPSVFFKSNVPPMTSKNADKIHLFRDFQFSLVIENSRQNNYFTEKLCDCLYTKTIPIYYGAPNIHEYFNTTGWIILDSESVDSLKDKLSTLDEDWFQRYLSIVEENYITVQKYLSYEKNLNNVLDILPDY